MTTRAQGIGCDLLPSVRLSRSSAYESRLLEGVSREALMIRSRWSLGTRTRLGVVCQHVVDAPGVTNWEGPAKL